MNNTKRVLIIIAIIFNFISACLDIWFVTDLFLYYQLNQWAIVNIIYYFISIFASFAGAGCLIYAIANKGQFFRQRHGYFVTAVIISVCTSFFSVSTVLLLIASWIPDIVWVRPQDDVYFQSEKPKEDTSKEEKIARLRKLRDDGLITEEEFKEELFKLL